MPIVEDKNPWAKSKFGRWDSISLTPKSVSRMESREADFLFCLMRWFACLALCERAVRVSLVTSVMSLFSQANDPAIKKVFSP